MRVFVSASLFMLLSARLYQRSLVGQSVFEPAMAIVELTTFTKSIESKLEEIFKDVMTIDRDLYLKAKSSFVELADQSTIKSGSAAHHKQDKHKFKVKFCDLDIELVAVDAAQRYLAAFAKTSAWPSGLIHHTCVSSLVYMTCFRLRV